VLEFKIEELRGELVPKDQRVAQLTADLAVQSPSMLLPTLLLRPSEVSDRAIVQNALSCHDGKVSAQQARRGICLVSELTGS